MLSVVEWMGLVEQGSTGSICRFLYQTPSLGGEGPSSWRGLQPVWWPGHSIYLQCLVAIYICSTVHVGCGTFVLVAAVVGVAVHVARRGLLHGTSCHWSPKRTAGNRVPDEVPDLVRRYVNHVQTDD